MAKQIQLTQGYFATVDDEDYERVSQFRWMAQLVRRRDGKILKVYACRYVPGRKGLGGTRQYLHRFISNVDDPLIEVDHWDHDGLNCQSLNLRQASTAQNAHNQRIPINNTSGFKGISWDRRKRRWRARINIGGKHLSLKSFDTPEGAAHAYDEAAIKYWGEFAYTNFPIIGVGPSGTNNLVAPGDGSH